MIKPPIGCHADGAHGMHHLRDVLAELLTDYATEVRDDYEYPGCEYTVEDLISALERDEPSDDRWEEEEALEALSNAFAGSYARFEMCDGDLICTPEPESAIEDGVPRGEDLPERPEDADCDLFLAVNERGNTTLYGWTGEAWRELWSLV